LKATTQGVLVTVADWFESYAQALEEKLGHPEPGLHLAKEARNPLLDMARNVAHGTERKNAPLAAYVTGRYVAERAHQGIDEDAALAEALAAAESIIPAAE
jgi:Domain of unknown function (DUF6457)